MSLSTYNGITTRVYDSFRGVDFRGEDINVVRSPDSLNMWKDYREIDSVRTRPKEELLKEFESPIYGIFFYGTTNKPEIIVHSGAKLWKIVGETTSLLFNGCAERVSHSFVYDSKFYFKDGKNYLVYDGKSIHEVTGYIPTTSIGRKPNGGGSIYEDVNLLSPYRRNTFLADGESVTFRLDAQNIDSDYKPIVRINAELTEAFTVDFTSGSITFTEAPPKPLTDGQDNVSVQFRRTVSGYADKIKKCTLLQVFDNRVFFSGNPDYPNVLWHSSLNDPSYCSDLDYYNEGLDNASIRGLVAGNNVLWVFREPSDANTTVFYHIPTIDSEYGKIYPSAHSSISTGCIGRAINFNDDIVFFSDRGMEGISGDITTEQVIKHRSAMVDRKLTSEGKYADMVLCEWEGYLFVCIENKVYLADSRAMFANENHNEYEFFYWELEHNVLCANVNGGVLYLGTDNGIYTLTDREGEVFSYWTTPKDKLGSINRQKTSNKRGCVVEGSGDMRVYAKTEDTEFELISEHKDITDYIVCKIKRKKFKDIQIKFETDTRFSLEMASLEVFQGGYIKR